MEILHAKSGLQKYVQMRAPKTAAYYISPIEIGLLWAKIKYVKSNSNALGFDPQTDMKYSREQNKPITRLCME